MPHPVPDLALLRVGPGLPVASSSMKVARQAGPCSMVTGPPVRMQAIFEDAGPLKAKAIA